MIVDEYTFCIPIVTFLNCLKHFGLSTQSKVNEIDPIELPVSYKYNSDLEIL